MGRFKSYPTNSGIKKAIKRNQVLLNGKIGKTSDFVSGGERIQLLEPLLSKPKPVIDIPLQVLFQDEYFAVINKPAGIEVSGNKKWTLENALSNHISKSNLSDALNRAQPVHRLDYPTSGVLIVAKTASMVIALSKMFEHKEIQKYYLAITIGAMPSAYAEIKEPVDEKPSHSTYKVIQSVASPRFAQLNLVQLEPHTGRRHQLRKHMLHIGNPILGDLLYAKENLALKGKGLYLHAHKIEFKHPISDEALSISAPIHAKFSKIFTEIEP
ncbi:RluA family pseudouridine synthase [Saccharicrinis aurantiacus]|uniref:RluA family pseudouridine synthase n=1 Tax=Saccharicrinis aurantiacus TaxID=1849719 RepID=UPI001C9E7DF8|nr:RluA family pseudouridine synthase [Saccharicrinis aurantiacus]